MKKNILESLRVAKLVNAQPNLCWVNATNVMAEDGYDGAAYVEGAVISLKLRRPQEHGWIEFNGEIIDPTLPEMELHYFPAHSWTGEEFLKAFFRYHEKPFFRHIEFMVDGFQVEMDKARATAKALAEQWD